MAMHESQSLFQEMQIVAHAANSGASPCRWRAIIWARSNLPASRSTTSSRMCRRSRTGYIRVDADEVTYPLHVILRFEIEKDLIEGRLAAKDVPEAWDAKMRDYLGLSTIDNPKDGPDAGRALAVGRLRLFPELYAGSPDRGAAARRHGARHARPRRADRAAATSRPSTTGAAARSGRRPPWPRPMPSCARPPAKAFRPGTSRTT